MGAGIAVRRAVAVDAAAIDALYRQLVSNAAVQVLPERLAELADNPATHLLVAERDGQVCGTVLLSFCADAMFGHQPFAVIENLVVDASRRGARIGEQLMCEAEARCREAGCSKIMLKVYPALPSLTFSNMNDHESNF